MIKCLLPAFLLLVGCLGGLDLPEPTIPEPPPVNLMERALNSTVALVDPVTGRSYCSGVMWNDKVLTAAHCVDEDVPLVSVAFRHEEMRDKYGYFSTDHSFLVVHRDSVQDFAILGAAELVPSAYYENSPIATSNPGAGDAVVVVGHPLGATYTITEGIVSHPGRVEWEEGPFQGQHFLQISAQVYFGNSGGPVFTRYGEVVGIVSFLMGVPHLGGAVHPDVIREYTDQ